MSAASEALLSFENVSFSYDREAGDAARYAVNNISFSVEPGAFIAILGRNGSGKSTLAKLANGICVPDRGSVTVAGRSTADPANELEIRKRVGMVFQNPDNQIVSSIVEEDVAFGPENLCLPPEEIRKRVDDAMNAVGIYELRHHETHRLSGGQKQRVAIAGMIAMRPACLILDESTAMLDPQGRKDVLETVRRLNREQGVAIVLITHFMEEALAADRVLLIEGGRLTAQGTPQEIFTQKERIEQAGLALPEAALLAQELRRRGVPIPPNIIDEAQLAAALLRLF